LCNKEPRVEVEEQSIARRKVADSKQSSNFERREREYEKAEILEGMTILSDRIGSENIFESAIKITSFRDLCDSFFPLFSRTPHLIHDADGGKNRETQALRLLISDRSPSGIANIRNSFTGILAKFSEVRVLPRR
jgi:hypothetical protein